MGNYNKHLIVIGSARSGTSWLSEVMARQFRYRMLFEPEHEFNTKDGKLLCDRWIASSIEAPQAHRYLKRVFRNSVDNDWIGQISNRKFKMHLWPLIPKKYIIKFVRTNLAAKYINETFKIPVIHIIRDPYDVLASQQRVKFPWLYNLKYFQEQPRLVQLVKQQFNFDLSNTTTYSPLEILTIRWCMENVLPLQLWEPYQFEHSVVRYEELRNDLQVFLDLCDKYEVQPLADIHTEYRRPSSKTHPKSTIIYKKAEAPKLTNEEIKQINKLLDIFQCNLYPRRE